MRKVLISFMAVSLLACHALAAPPALGVPTSALPTSVPTALPPAPAQVPQPIFAELNDGSKIEIDADDTVWVLGEDKSKTPAPDGTLTLKDGTPFVVKEGKRVPGED